jgi:hypothetical protein
MMPGERRRIAERVRDRYRRARKEPEPTIEETDLTVEERFDLELTGIDKHFLDEMKVGI